MKPKKKKKIWGWIVFFSFLTIMFLIGYYCSISIREEDQAIEENGIKGIGTITSVNASNRTSEGGKKLTVRYEYKVDDKIYSYVSIDYAWGNLQDAIVGMKYEIKYLKEDPQKSIIYFDLPIVSEYKNIEKVRDSLRTTGKKEYKKGLKYAEPIESVKARYPEYFR